MQNFYLNYKILNFGSGKTWNLNEHKDKNKRGLQHKILPQPFSLNLF